MTESCLTTTPLPLASTAEWNHTNKGKPWNGKLAPGKGNQDVRTEVIIIVIIIGEKGRGTSPATSIVSHQCADNHIRCCNLLPVNRRGSIAGCRGFSLLLSGFYVLRPGTNFYGRTEFQDIGVHEFIHSFNHCFQQLFIHAIIHILIHSFMYCVYVLQIIDGLFRAFIQYFINLFVYWSILHPSSYK